ncbi:winged helix-turn-helix domain-containing protein [Hyphococcus sp.]|uniref:winged helix-turn-helix domain-containing protein n=1 Tax=Hyphococcus sp. TaxID=2038636 RepID=UPI003CCB7CEF
MSLTQTTKHPSDPAENCHIRLGAATYDPKLRIVTANGGAQPLEPKLGELLVLLATSDGPVSRDALLDRIWGDEGSDEALTQAVSKLRRALGDVNRPYAIIQTVPRYGYQIGNGIAVPVHSVEAADDSRSITSGLRAHVNRRREFYFGALCGAGLVIVAVAILVLLNPPRLLEKEVICGEGVSAADCVTTIRSGSDSPGGNRID